MGAECSHLVIMDKEQLLEIIDRIEEYANMHNLNIEIKTQKGIVKIIYELNRYDDFVFTRGENQN
jgi:hypothetical protein